MNNMNKSTSTSNHKAEKVIVTFFTLAFIAWSAIFIFRTSFIAIDDKRYFCLFDDAMISMRYAWNFSHGEGLVWNTGERVQGYTNLLMTLLMSLGTLVFDKSAAALSIQILGMGLMIVIAHTSMGIADHILVEDGYGQPGQGVVRILSYVLALSYYPLTYWSLMGMETGLLTVLLLFGILSAFNYGTSKKPIHILLTAIYLGLAFLTRNDSLIFALLIGAYLLWENLNSNTDRKARFQLFSGMLLYLIFVTGQFLFQYLYYGELLPNTYILKLTGMSLMDRISNGLGFIMAFLIQVSFLLIPATTNLFLRFQKGKMLLLSLVLSSIGYQIYIGGDPWNYWRMMSPTMPLLNILFISAINTGLRAQTGMKDFNPRLLRGYSSNTQISLVVLLGLLVGNIYFMPEILFLERPFYVSANQHNVNIAVALSEVTTSDASAGVFWAGAIPYFAERTGIDFLGKSDRYIAHLPPDLSGKISVNGMKSPPGHNKYDLNYSIKQLQPTYVQAFNWGTQDLTPWAETMYIEVEYKGSILFLLRNSPAVLWEKVNDS